jgi:cytochrome c peroxidase
MHDRTHPALRFALRLALHGGSALVALAIAAAASGCNQEGPLTDQEMEQLRGFMLPPEGPPADTSNAFADNRGAARLGKRLYFDGGYSGGLGPYNVRKDVNGALGAAGDPGLVSCRSCHDPATGGVDNRSKPNATSLGAGYTARNAPTVINAAYSPLWQFWDGRVDSLWSQALAPPEGGVECNSSRLEVVHFLYANYRSAFEEVFGAGSLPDLIANLPAAGKPGDQAFDELDDAPGGAKDVVNRAYANFGKAIAAYERLLISNNFEASNFDRFMNGDKEAMSPAAIRGARLFVGHAGCTECHRGPMFSDFSFHNVGAPQTGEYASATDNGRFDGVTALTSASNMYTRSSALYSDDTTSTTYLESLKGSPPTELKGQFKTPTLRNVAKTAPYMHDGVYQTLWDVVNHYNFGGASGQFAGDKDHAISPLMLSDAELADLVEFLRALDDGETAIVGDDLPGGLVGLP